MQCLDAIVLLPGILCQLMHCHAFVLQAAPAQHLPAVAGSSEISIGSLEAQLRGRLSLRRLAVAELAPQLHIARVEFAEPLIASSTLRRALGSDDEKEALLPAEQPLHRWVFAHPSMSSPTSIPASSRVTTVDPCPP